MSGIKAVYELESISTTYPVVKVNDRYWCVIVRNETVTLESVVCEGPGQFRQAREDENDTLIVRSHPASRGF